MHSSHEKRRPRWTVIGTGLCALLLALAPHRAFAQDTEPGQVEPSEPAPDAPREDGPSDAPTDGAPSEDAGPAPSEPAPSEGEAADAPEEGLEPEAPAGDSGVRGRVVDSRTGAGLPDAVVMAQGPRGSATAMTDEAGAYTLVLPPGLYTVSALYDLYHGARMPRVRVRSARWSDLVLTLDPIDDNVVAEEIEIVYRADTTSAAAQDQLRAASSGIGEGMGAAQMSQSGASDAGSAARNVVGVSLEGANLNIRGLGGRYTLVLLNGVPLPSTDPDVPSVDLDLFPTSVIDALQIAKAFQPDLPGSFAGGVLDIRTVRFPRQFTFELSGGLRMNSMTAFRDTFGYRGGDLDWLGVDDGTRALPSGLNDRVAVSRNGAYQSFDAVEAVAERFPNIWGLQDQTLGLGFGLELTLGDAIALGDQRRFGYLVTASYDYAPSFRGNGSARLGDARMAGVNEQYRYEGGTAGEEVALNALGTASLELGQDDVVTFLSLFNRIASDETSLQRGFNYDLMGDVERWQLQYIARTLFFNQLRGDHRNMFGTRLRLRWQAYGGYAGREEPDRRTVTYGPQGSIARRWLEKSQSGERFYSSLEQLDAGGVLDLRFPLWSQAWADVGLHFRNTSRSFLNRRFRMMQDPRNMDQEAYQADIEELFGPQGIGTLTRIQEFSRPDDSYVAEQRYYAAYAMLETPIAGPLSLTGGARFEAFEQRIASQSPIPAENTMPTEEVRGTDRTDADVLPAANLRLELTEGMVLRAAYGMTVARPQIRELAPYQYYDFIRDRNVQGNPDLARTLIQNADLRWEWFFGTGEILAFSLFYKYFDQPIELLIRNQQNYDSQFINASQAHNLGGEAELRFNFRRFAPELSILTFEANVAVVWSTVQLPTELAGAVRSERPLYGQAPYVANLSLHLDEPASGLRASVVYNLTGPRLTDVGTRVGDVILPDIYRQPFHSLDLVLTWRVDDHLRLRLKLQNLLFQEELFVQGTDFLVARFEPGMSGSLGLTYSY
jgi:outer membrane receptor protein involved in Fe transport